MRYVELPEGIEAFDATSEILKLVARRKGRHSGRRLLCFHSWRDVLSGGDGPLDESEMEYFSDNNCAHIHLVASPAQQRIVESCLQRPSIVLPLTVFQNPAVYQLRDEKPAYDAVFFCMFTPEHFLRKRADLVLCLAARYRNLRLAWIGGYSPFERWQMEEAFNSHFHMYGEPPSDWLPLWTEEESFRCWYDGGGVFRDEVQKHQFLRDTWKDARNRGLSIQFYKNLTREQVVTVLNRSRVTLATGRLDQWPRCITESLACGTPVVCVSDLKSGLELVSQANGAIVEPDPDAIYDGIREVNRLQRERIHDEFYERYGLFRATRTLVKEIEALGVRDWTDIVSVQRPAETQLKKAVRSAL